MMPGVVCLPHGWGHSLEGVQLRVAATRPGVPSNFVADTQRVTGAILGYMTRMGVSSQVIEAMSQTREIRWLDPKDAEAMKLVSVQLKPL